MDLTFSTVFSAPCSISCFAADALLYSDHHRRRRVHQAHPPQALKPLQSSNHKHQIDLFPATSPPTSSFSSAQSPQRRRARISLTASHPPRQVPPPSCSPSHLLCRAGSLRCH
ncbi:hypothetical protein M0R45_010220 [Rubus argutus]|uniref:Uncharacterized protein n=1 Tax=Rubus argutus TaxID=59490 RepID=A0AAW1Y6F2_RUBAR